MVSRIVASRSGGATRSTVRDRRRGLVVEALEPRVVMSASALHDMSGHASIPGESDGHLVASVRQAHDLADTGVAQNPVTDPGNIAKSVFSGLPTIPFNQFYEDCSGNALAADIDYNILKGNTTGSTTGSNLITTQGFLPSRLFLYYNTRFISHAYDGMTNGFTKEAGTRIDNAVNSAINQGIATEGTVPITGGPKGATFPYPPAKLTDFPGLNPGAANYVAARMVRITGASFIKLTTSSIETALKGGQPVLIGLRLPKNFPGLDNTTPKNSSTIPLPGDSAPGSGHFMLIVGYNNAKKSVIVLNSWSKNFGTDGYAYLPDSYLTEKWAFHPITISGITVSTKPAPSIGNLTQLTTRANVDTLKGQVNIDTAASSSTPPANSTATSFDFYGKTTGWVTPLIFNDNAGTYTLTGIGAAFDAGTGSQGIPFHVTEGSADVTSTSRFGFYDGESGFMKNQQNVKRYFTEPAAGVIPYSPATNGSADWFSSTKAVGLIGKTGPFLRVGLTFSINESAGAKVTLSDSGDAYSAMLNE